MKILVIGDLHGQIPKIHFKEFDIIIAPGDFCLDTDIRKYSNRAYKEFLTNPYESLDWWDIIGRREARKYISKSLKYGRKILEKLNSYNVPVYVIPGNWDFIYESSEWDYLNKNWYKSYIIKGLKNIKDVHHKLLRVGDMNIIGYGMVNGPELLKYRYYNNISKKRYEKNRQNYKKLLSNYDKLFRKAAKSKKNHSSVIFLSHNVPFNTKLDKIVNKKSLKNGYHYGSNLARDMTLMHSPLLCIGGHMHEHYGTCKLGKTIVLNAGFGGEKNTLVEVKDGKIKKILFHGKKK